jgi:hypothetical protein
MTPRMRRGLIALYPRWWRARYQEEFGAFLDREPFVARTVLNIVCWACYERIRSTTEHVMTTPRRGLVLLLYAYLAAITAGVNLFWTVDDTPLIGIMQAHRSLRVLWQLLAWGAFIAFGAIMAGAIPILFGMVRSAVTNRRYDVLRRLAFPPGALAALVIWIGVVVRWTHWAPTPWDITGDWHAPEQWPSLHMRWILGGITGVLLVVGVIGSAIALKQAIERGEPSPSRFVRRVLLVLAGSIVCMAASVTGWGLLTEVYASAVFHARAGGLFGSTTISSWAVSCALFAGAAIAALRGASLSRTPAGGSLS